VEVGMIDNSASDEVAARAPSSAEQARSGSDPGGEWSARIFERPKANREGRKLVELGELFDSRLGQRREVNERLLRSRTSLHQ
jgi:hypothetical protein